MTLTDKKESIDERTERVAEYIKEERATVRNAAKKFGLSKSTVHKDMVTRLEKIDSHLYEKVREILDINKAERHLRGGYATQRKFRNSKKKDL
ncbi:MAG: sporulation transcriptional regulator SpoIIID [Clostridiales bacterium]|nr:sporulation transcriptional regulator SpoIIID [Clostridia bacterium]MCR5353646.1 sporulation transcriptional regulator SpoIIID [Clostridiales bacterium]